MYVDGSVVATADAEARSRLRDAWVAKMAAGRKKTTTVGRGTPAVAISASLRSGKNFTASRDLKVSNRAVKLNDLKRVWKEECKQTHGPNEIEY